MSDLRIESHFIPLDPSSGVDRLHLRRFFRDEAAPPVLMLHGAIENGKIFYSDSGKGLAPYLAAQGFDVFVADLRGRGLSTPAISKDSKHGQYESIVSEIPRFSEKMRELKGDVPQHWLAHSWGGVLFLSHLARAPEQASAVRSLVCFGTKRSVRVWNPERICKIDLGWNGLLAALTKVRGYLPARELGIGSDNETLLSHLESVSWVKAGRWVDPRDGFDYESALRGVKLPPILFVAGMRDNCLGHPEDMKRLLREAGNPAHEFWNVAYGHIDMLTHPKATQEHFPRVAEWMRRA